MTHRFKKTRWKVLVVCSVVLIASSVVVCSKAIGEKMSSYSPVVIKEGKDHHGSNESSKVTGDETADEFTQSALRFE